MIKMVGIDYKLAPIELREQFSFTEDGLKRAYGRIKDMVDIQGAVLLSTCNRTELYLSSEACIDSFETLCSLAGVEGRSHPHYSAEGSDVMHHLCLLGSGVKSQIMGEDQIIAQVKEAIATSRELSAPDNVLEVLFRESVAAAKKIKSVISFGVRENSIVHKAMDAIYQYGELRRALVIGNGEIGRLMTRTLVEKGFHTSMTLRTYRHGETLVPAGAHAVDYAARYQALSGCDVLISATRSPHHTIKLEEVQGCTAYPKLWLDLALPRDIDPAIATLPGTVYHDVDSLSAGEVFERREEKTRQAEEIIEKYVADFEKWLTYQHVINAEGRKEYFPLFVSSKGRKALIAGGGKIALRRAQTLMQFEFDLTIVAPTVLPELQRLHEKGRLNLICREFRDTDLDGCFLAIAATDKREVNRHIGKQAQNRGIFASVADKYDECGFLFPAIAVSGDIVAGLTSGGKSHHAVVEAARKVRGIL